MLEIIRRLEQCWATKSSAAIATIIQTAGSTYRSVGAKSIILPDGTILGTLSGGCIEEDIFEHAKNVMSTLIPRIIDYDFFGDEDLPWGLGVGCNGALKIWIEPFEPIKQQEKALETLTILQNQISTATIISSSHPHLYPIATRYNLDQAKSTQMIHPSKAGLFTVKDDDVQLEIYYEKLKKIPRLIILGAGPDAVPLVRGAKLLNWLVTVVDHRPGYANKEKFPEADELIISTIGKFPENLDIYEKDYVVIMTHHFEQDSLFLNHLLSYRLSYLGILGPRKRTERILKEQDILSKEYCHSPIGLDIGAETPEEIAISILSEIISYATNSPGMPLKKQNGPIHKKGIIHDWDTSFSRWIFDKIGRTQMITKAQ
ncbi:XdhC family protein [Bacillus sp. Marseille-P3661]|uniref:XdhC family protein n=1 Tax=Bacillus sp. Marseille-P3661 TaxID=1936234 RepID=UPI0015E1A025|nr:XdhC/CoxI family protein [Bacillus sp. Marseille-P3661]